MTGISYEFEWKTDGLKPTFNDGDKVEALWTIDARAGQKKKAVFKGKVLEVVRDVRWLPISSVTQALLQIWAAAVGCSGRYATVSSHG